MTQGVYRPMSFKHLSKNLHQIFSPVYTICRNIRSCISVRTLTSYNIYIYIYKYINLFIRRQFYFISCFNFLIVHDEFSP